MTFKAEFCIAKVNPHAFNDFFNVLQSIFFLLYISIIFSIMPCQKRTWWTFFFSEDLPRWLGSFSLPWSLWAGKRRTLNSTKNRGFWGLVWTDFFPRPGFYSDSAEFCRKKKQLGDERIFSARQRFSKPNSQTDTQCACSQLGLSSQHTIGTFGNICSEII